MKIGYGVTYKSPASLRLTTKSFEDMSEEEFANLIFSKSMDEVRKTALGKKETKITDLFFNVDAIHHLFVIIYRGREIKRLKMKPEGGFYGRVTAKSLHRLIRSTRKNLIKQEFFADHVFALKQINPKRFILSLDKDIEMDEAVWDFMRHYGFERQAMESKIVRICTSMEEVEEILSKLGARAVTESEDPNLSL